MVGERYWTTGITLKYNNGTWAAELDFFDDGWCEDACSEGSLRIRYFVGDLPAAIDTLIADATRLGIEFTDARTLYYWGDGEDTDHWPPPENWRQILREQVERLGWRNVYPEG